MEMEEMKHKTEDIVGPTVQLLLDCERQGLKQSNQLQPSIYMVPNVFRNLSPSSFTPRVVSIGPLHRDDANLQGFEAQKPIYLHDLLHLLVGASPPEEILTACVQKVSGSIDRIKKCYAGLESYDDVQLSRMMVMDGFFILDFIHHLLKQDGPLWGNTLITQSVIYDLLLVENQIPFFVLEDIFEFTILKLKPTTSLTKFILPFLNIINFLETDLKIENVTSPDHILGLLHRCYQLKHAKKSRFPCIPKVQSAVALDRTGVKFKPNQNGDWPVSMKLQYSRFACSFLGSCCKPALRMPVLCIDDFTELVLRNLIIYEQSCQVPNYISSYACTMDMLIDTPDDVARLIKSKVLINDLGSNDKAADMINNICKEVAIIDFFYYQQWDQLYSYYHSYWPSIIAGWKRRYFNSPWNIIALSAGIILFALTVVQTIFSIKAA